MFRRSPKGGFDKPGKGQFGKSDPTPVSSEDHPDVPEKGPIKSKRRKPKLVFKTR